MTAASVGRALLVALGVALHSATAHAEAPRVALLHATGPPDPVLEEALSRLRSELISSGFSVTETTTDSTTPEAALDSVAGTATAAFSIRRAPGSNTVEIWVADRLTGKTVVRRISLSRGEAGNAASLLAIRAAELLRASLLEATVEPKRKEKSASSPARKLVSPTLARFVGKVEPSGSAHLFQGPHLLAGVVGLYSFAGFGPSVAPALRAGFGFPSGLSVRLSLMGPTLTPELSSSAGSAAIRQELGLFEIAYSFGGAGSRWVPIAAVGGGVYHVTVKGSARAPFEGHAESAWAALADVSVGGALRLSKHAALVLDAHALLAEPAPEIQIDVEKAGALGRPALLTCFSVVASL